MKKFIYKTFFFLLPILVFLIGIEVYVRNDSNSFKSIATYFENNKDNIEVLVLGSSHNQNGINPKYFDKKTANISYGAQDIKIDSALVFDKISKMKNLKSIVFEWIIIEWISKMNPITIVILGIFFIMISK